MFRDRTDAGKKLAERLSPWAGKDAVVLALPRGGVILAREIAEALSLPLDIVVTRKVGHPSSPEFAIGAVNERGETILTDAETRILDKEWLRSEIEAKRKEAEHRNKRYRKEKQAVDIKDKTVILVDDGIATGLSMRLAVRGVKNAGARHVIVAVPVAPAGAAFTLQNEGADEVIVLLPPEAFLGAVGSHYREFDQISDEEVMRHLRGVTGEDSPE